MLPLSFAVIQYIFIEDLNMTTDTGIVSLPLCLLVLYIAYTARQYYEQISETDLFCCRLVGSTLLRKKLILVYHHCTLN